MVSLAGGIIFYEYLLIGDGKASAEDRRTTYRLTSAVLMSVGIFISGFALTKWDHFIRSENLFVSRHEASTQETLD